MKSELALHGGPKVCEVPHAPWPVYSKEMISAAVRVLESGRGNYWSGNECSSFEDEFAEHHGVQYAVALANGTLALELALKVLKIGHGDEVIVTPRSYFASASSIALSGATPIFADVDPDSQNVTADTIEPLISSRTKALLVVHLAGWPCDMYSITELARRRDLKVIEDCAQAHGARYDGKLVGTFGDIGAFSFCQDKIMSTAGEGGMLITNERDLWEPAWSFKDHGKNWNRTHDVNHPLGFRWLHDGFGSNWRLTELQASIGRLQLELLDSWIARRRLNAERLAGKLVNVAALRIPWPADKEQHSFYKFYAFVRREKLKREWSRDKILQALAAEGVPGLSGSCPEIYREKAFADRLQPPLPVAHELGQTSLMFQVHPTLTDAEIDETAAAVCKVFEAASL